ncbi:hypothetical protein MRX96_020537 [Rhipicephalus microplus]
MARPNLRTEGRASEVPLNDGIEAVASRKKESAALERPVEPWSALPENETKTRPVSGAASLPKGRHVSPEKRTRLDRVTGKPLLAENFGRKRNAGTIALRGGKKRAPERDWASQLADIKRNPPWSALPENETKTRPVSGAASLPKGRHVSPEKRTRLDRVTGKPLLAENFGRKRNAGTIALRGGKKRAPERDWASQLADIKRNPP